MTPAPLPPTRTPLATATTLLVATGYLLAGLWFVWFASPRVPYADSYRFLSTFDALPFPQDALAADNGHREVLTNLVRIAEFEWFGASQWLQTATGGLALLGAVALLANAWRGTGGTARAAAACLIAVGVFWLGNTRKLAHGSELAHLGPIVLYLVLGLRSLTSAAAGTRHSWFAAAMGLAATLSFGSGLAAFPAFAAVLWARRAAWSAWLPVAAGGAAALALLLLGGSGDSARPVIDPLAQLDLWLRWLGAPFVWVVKPLLDPAHAARLPLGVLGPAWTGFAQQMHDWFGPALAARFPGLLIGLGGLGLLSVKTVQFRRNPGNARQTLALGLAWFGACVGVLVVALRVAYFAEFPDQITSQRYLPWSMLFWLGLALAWCAAPTRSPAAALRLALGVALLFLPSQVWTGRNALRTLQTAELTAAGAVVGAIDPQFALVETMPGDLRRAVPMLQRRGAAMFAWPEAHWLGQRPAAEQLRAVAIAEGSLVSWRHRGNLLPDGPPDAASASFWVDGETSGRLLLLDGTGTVQGLAVREPAGHEWHGWLRQFVPAGELRVAALR